MEQRRTEIELLQKAVKAFRQATGVRLRMERFAPNRAGGRQADFELRLTAPQTETRLGVKVTRWLNPQTLGLAIERIKRVREKVLLVTEYVNPNMAERLKQMGIPFLDTVGNAYVNVPPLLIYIKGHKPPAKTPVELPTRALGPAGLKVVFALLCRQEMIDAPYRTIARTTDVALGTVAWVLRDLERLGHLLEMGKRGRRLIHKRDLAERWAGAYTNQLRPRLIVGRYASPAPDWWDRVQVREFRAYWGGEVAAARLTRYLKPEFVTVYVRGLPGRFLAANRLRTDPKGNVELLKAFWNADCDWTEGDTVHPLLVYADLLRTGDARNIEAARRIYDEQLARLVREG